MDILNTQAIDSNVIDPLLNRLKAEIIPALEGVIQRQANSGALQLSNIVQGTLLGIQATEDKAAADVRGLLAGLDGWTLDITIPPITLRLSAPKVAV